MLVLKHQRYAEDLSKLNITTRICFYHKNSGNIYKGYLFVTNTNFISILPETFAPGVDTISLTQAQLNLLKTSLSKGS